MIDINAILNFIGEKRPKYKIENWPNLNLKKRPMVNSDGKIMGKYNENGKKEGYWLEEWEDNNNKFSEGKYVDGLKNGFWIFYHTNGRISHKGNYVNDRKLIFINK